MALHTTVPDLIAVLADLAAVEPTATLERNDVGNLVIVVGDVIVGYVDLVSPYWRYF